MNELLKIKEWDESYEKGDNYVWHPHEEIIRFSSKYFMKKIDIDKFENKSKNNNLKALDFGCGIGRHVIFLSDLQIESYGVDISKSAINKAMDWCDYLGKRDLKENFIFVDGHSKLPFNDNFFDFVISHGVFDSMYFDIAKKNLINISRVLKSSGLMYLDLISGNDHEHYREYCGEEIVKNEHERGTIQSYYNFSKIERLISDTDYKINEINLIKKENVLSGTINSRYHIILRLEK